MSEEKAKLSGNDPRNKSQNCKFCQNIDDSFELVEYEQLCVQHLLSSLINDSEKKAIANHNKGFHYKLYSIIFIVCLAILIILPIIFDCFKNSIRYNLYYLGFLLTITSLIFATKKTGKIKIAMGNAYALRSGQLEDLLICIKHDKGEFIKAGDLAKIITTLRRSTMEETVLRTIENRR
jgi:hypothetical protein